jgi:hypothetical protein
MKPRAVVEPDKRSAWQRKLDEECPYQVVASLQFHVFSEVRV